MYTSYLFYDLETSGLNKAFDQIIQFAAIRTDTFFNEIERYELMIRPNPDTIPSPYAAITHRTKIDHWLAGEAEPTAISKIHQLFNTPGTLSIGYNTLGFDDEFLRFNFYRNLLPAYTHQYANDCGRADLYPIAALYYLFQTSCITWPKINTKQSEKISLKLENINQINQLTTGMAHTAIVDVAATVELAKKFAQQEKTWNYALDYFNKNKDLDRINQLSKAIEYQQLADYGLGLLIDGRFGSDANFLAPVLALGIHRYYKNQYLLLRLDTNELIQSSLDNFTTTCWVINKKLGEPGFILPANQKYLSKLTEKQQQKLSNNLAFLNKHTDLLSTIKQHYLNFQYPPVPETDVDAALYLNGFMNYQQQAECKNFHQANYQDKAKIIQQIQTPYIKQLAIRILGRYDAELLQPQQQTDFTDYLARLYQPAQVRLVDYKHQSKRTKADAITEINEIKQAHQDKKQLLDQEQLILLNEFSDYIDQLN